MIDNKQINNTKYLLTLVIFFAAGVLSVIGYQNWQKGNILASTNTDNETGDTLWEPSITPTPTSDWIPYPTVTLAQAVYTAPSTKLTIYESKKITADKTTAETGETVNYNVTLKNTGDKKKFLTHICFNHSGGITFGCLLNMNLEPDKEFNINNSMMYKTPGGYSVWITWSQDGTNFYKPQGGGSARVTVY